MDKRARRLFIFSGVLVTFSLLVWFGGLSAAFGKAHQNLARKLYARGEYTEALRAYKIAGLLGFPHEREQAAALFHLGRYDQADRLLARKGMEPGSLVTHGVILVALGKTEEASRSFRFVLDIPSWNGKDKALAAYNLSLLLRDSGKKGEARKMLERALLWSKGDASHWHGPQPISPRDVQLWAESDKRN